MGAFTTVLPPDIGQPSPTADEGRSAAALAGSSAMEAPTPEKIALQVKREIDAIRAFVEGFAVEYPQAQKAAKIATEAVQNMGEAVISTLEAPLGTPLEAPPRF